MGKTLQAQVEAVEYRATLSEQRLVAAEAASSQGAQQHGGSLDVDAAQGGSGTALADNIDEGGWDFDMPDDDALVEGQVSADTHRPADCGDPGTGTADGKTSIDE